MIVSGRAGALLPLSPLRTGQASFQASGSSKVTPVGNVPFDGNIDVTKLGF